MTEEREAAMSRLALQGKEVRESAGQYDEQGATLPKYDVEAIRAAMPEYLQISFFVPETETEVEEKGFFAVLERERGDSVTVSLGGALPDDTEALIVVIREHFRSGFDLKGMAETSAALAAFDDEEGA